MRTRSGLKYQDNQIKATEEIKSPTKEKVSKIKAKSEVKDKQIEANVEKTESKRTRSKPNTDIRAKKIAISPKKSPKRAVLHKQIAPKTIKTRNTKKVEPNESHLSEEDRSDLKCQDNQITPTDEIKSPTKEKISKLKAKKEVKDKQMENSSNMRTRSGLKNQGDLIKDKQEIKAPIKEKVSKIKARTEVKDKQIEANVEKRKALPNIQESIDTKEAQTTPEPQISSVKRKNSESDDLPPKTEVQSMDTKEIETTPEPQISTIKRKSSESDGLPPKMEAIKRLRVSRFSVPSIPQICGQLYSFGEEIAGELGPRLKRVDDIKLKSNEPSIVTDKDGLTLDNIVSVVCGAMHSSCLSSEGEVITFGCNDDSALGRDTQTGSDETDDSIDIDESEEKEARTPKIVSGVPSVIKLTAGDMHTCALCKDGSVFVWGNFKDESKKLGLFADCPQNVNNDDFKATTLPKRIDLETKVIDIASGCHHILLLTEDGDVLSLGEGSKGQLGRIKDTELQTISSDRFLFLSPQKVEFGVGIVIEKVWADHWSSYAKTTSGDIYVWGLNNYHQLGFKSSGSVRVTNSDPNESQTSINLIIELKPTKVEEMPKNIVMIANGQHHMLALDSDGKVFSCGSNTYGKLGFKTDNNDQTAESPQMINMDAFNGQKVTHIACGEFCSFAITESGQLMAWGQGSSHIGSADFTDIEVPTRVNGSLADSMRFISVSSGSQHSLLIGNKNTINGN